MTEDKPTLDYARADLSKRWRHFTANEFLGDFALPAIPVGVVVGFCSAAIPGHSGVGLFDHIFEGFKAGLGLAIFGAAVMWIMISIRSFRTRKLPLARSRLTRAICGVIYAFASLGIFFFADQLSLLPVRLFACILVAIVLGLPVGMGLWLTRSEM